MEESIEVLEKHIELIRTMWKNEIATSDYLDELLAEIPQHEKAIKYLKDWDDIY